MDPSLCNLDKGKVDGSNKDAKEINSYLDFIKSNLLLKKREMEETGRAITAHDLKNFHLGIDEESKTILQVFKELNERAEGLINKDFAPRTVERYKTCYSHLQTFNKVKYNRNDIALYDVNTMFVNEFDYYLKTTRNCCNNTATKYIKNFKNIVRIALANGWMKKDPFATIKFHLDGVDMDFLNEKELTL